MGWTHPPGSVAGPTVPPLLATGANGQLTAVAGAAAGARHALPAAPALPQTRPVGQASPEAQAGAQYWPVDSWTQVFPEGQLPLPEQVLVQMPPGKSALSMQVSPLPQLGVQVAEPTSGVEPEQPRTSAATSGKSVEGIRT